MTLIPVCKTTINDKNYTPYDLQKIKVKYGKNNVILNNLVCIGCGVNLNFRNGNENRKPYLSTWPKKSHSGNCNLITTSFTNGNTANTLTELTELTTQDKLSKVKHLNKVLNDNISNKKSKNKSNVQKKKIPKKGEKSGNSNSFMGTNNPNETTSHNRTSNRSPRINNIPAQPLTPNMIGKTKLIYGLLKKVIVGTNYISLELNFNSQTLLINSSAAFYVNPSMTKIKSFETLKSIIDNGNHPSIAVFSNIQYSKNGKIEAIFYDTNDLYFSKKSYPLSVFISNN